MQHKFWQTPTFFFLICIGPNSHLSLSHFTPYRALQTSCTVLVEKFELFMVFLNERFTLIHWLSASWLQNSVMGVKTVRPWGVSGGRDGEVWRFVCVQGGLNKYIPFAVCQMSNWCWTLGNCSLIISGIDVERSVAITSTSRPWSSSSVMPLLKASASMVTELVDSVT